MTILDCFAVLISFAAIIIFLASIVYTITIYFAEIPGFQAKIAKGFSEIEEPYNE